MIYASQNGFVLQDLANVAEIGPGDSLGVGIAALLSGVENYTGFDAQKSINLSDNYKVYNNRVHLFQNCVPKPDYKEFPNNHPKLNDYSFLSSILTDEILSRLLAHFTADYN